MKTLAVVAVLLLAGCGGAHRTEPRVPKLPHALASAWRAQANGVAAALDAGDGCLAQQRAVALRASVIDAVNARRLRPRFQETLVGAVNDLASRIACVPPPPPAPAPPAHQGHGHGDDHPEHEKHGKHGKHDH
jgi:uncharacterized lipoprotein YmbA